VGARRTLSLAVAMVALGPAACSSAPPPGQPAGQPAATAVVVGIDLPFRGSAMEVSAETMAALRLYLEQVGDRAGRYPVELAQYDNSPPPNGSWDETECVRNANAHAANRREVAVIGTGFSTCSKIQVPILNRSAGGPMLLVSPSDSNPGLTRTWERDEPARYAPSGRRSYARVVPTDDRQATAMARFAAASANRTRCFVLDDGETYGVTMARAFAAEATRQGITVVGQARWKRASAGYRDLFSRVRAARADCVFLGGIYDNHGDQLIRDTAALGDDVALFAPDGFGGYPDLLRQPEAGGLYLTDVVLPIERLTAAGSPARFAAEYRQRYGRELTGARTFYALQALQVVLAAIERSDGSRAGVRAQVLAGAGIAIPADRAMLGRPVAIDPATGDVTAADIAVRRVSRGREVFVTVTPG
jgi:branched-chain amino acid transport system substrate-binding protein